LRGGTRLWCSGMQNGCCSASSPIILLRGVSDDPSLFQDAVEPFRTSRVHLRVVFSWSSRRTGKVKTSGNASLGLGSPVTHPRCAVLPLKCSLSKSTNTR